MAIEYGLKTGNLSEKDIVKMMNRNIRKILKKRNVNHNYRTILKKQKALGICDPDKPEEEFHFDYQYIFNEYNNFFVQLYTNVNAEQDIKFEIDGVTWNVYISDLEYDNMEKPFIEELLEGMPVEYVLVKEYGIGENRLQRLHAADWIEAGQVTKKMQEKETEVFDCLKTVSEVLTKGIEFSGDVCYSGDYGEQVYTNET